MLKKKFNNFKLTTQLSIISFVLYCIFGVFVYPLIPYLLNYPPNSIDNEFQLQVAGMKYSVQFILLFMIGIVLNSIILYFFFRKLNKWKKIYKLEKNEVNIKFVNEIRNLAANGIYKLLPIHIFVDVIVLSVVLYINAGEFLLILKLAIILCIWAAISDLLLFIFSSKIFNRILVETYEFVKDKKTSIDRISIGSKMIIQYSSCIVVILFILSLFGYSRVQYERGEFLNEKEYNELVNIIETNNDDILNVIKNQYSDYFIMDKNGNSIYNCDDFTEFAKEYILRFNEGNNRIYYQYGSNIEGVFTKVTIDSELYYIGKIYEVMPSSYSLYFIIFAVTLFGIYFIITICFIKNVTDSLRLISNNLNEIGSDKKSFGNQLAVTSNDEFSDLIIEYNKIQKNSEQYLKQIEEKQEIIVKQGQLVSIGELAGGVAHDINTPISAIKTGILMLNQMGGEKTEEEKEILQRMDNCATKIINIVNSMRNQIRNLGSDNNVKFKISDVVNDIKVITYHEVAKNRSEVIVDIKDDLDISGDPTKLGQVLTNLVVNAAQAYGSEKGGKIEVTVEKGPKSMAIIKVADYAGGLDPSIAPFIFKNILTTKGTVGTGLGLYLAYSVIKGNFNGEITFDTAQGEGTTFYIAIPRI